MTQEGKKQGMTSCGSKSSHGPHNMGWTRCGVHVPNVCEGRGRLVLLRTVRDHLVLNGRHPLFRVRKGPAPTDHSDEEWVEASRSTWCVPMQFSIGFLPVF
jgi:hypothetical protein